MLWRCKEEHTTKGKEAFFGNVMFYMTTTIEMLNLQDIRTSM